MKSLRFSRIALIAAFVVLAGCSYHGADQAAMFEMNTCTPQTDCGADAECRDGMCVAKSADMPLTIVLQVTPGRMRDGSEPQPIMLERFLVEGPMTRRFELRMPVPITGFVRNFVGGDELPIAATVTFTPVGLASGLPLRAVMATTSTSAPNAVETPDFTVQLLPGVEYRMAVQPSDSALPPYYQNFTFEDVQDVFIDYGPNMDAFTRTFAVSGATEARPLLVRAFDIATSELLSSTATVSDGTAVLRFAQQPPPFRVQVQAETSYDGALPAAADVWCDSNTPIFPVFSFAADELVTNADGETEISLPELPERIRFEGTIGLCMEAEVQAAIELAEMGQQGTPPAPLDSLPITLHSQTVLGTDGLPLAAVFEATTTATLDDASGELRFCVQVMPGEYDVLATAAASVPCAQFAEHFVISAPEGENASGPLLELPSAAYLKGTVQTMDLSPLSHAAVDAVALGRSEGITLDADDRSVTRYNRSRQTATEADGEFTLPVDLGSYDVVIKPPSGTGFSWQVRHDVAIGKRDMEFPTVIDMLSPLTLNGTLVYSNPNVPLEGAEIAAFAIIDDEFDTERAIPIGRATAGAQGEFTLLLPPSIHKGW